MKALAVSAGILSVLLGSTALGVAAETAIIDSQNPPPGFTPPKPVGVHDTSMAAHAPDAFLDGEEGIVDLKVLVQPDGTVSESQIAKPSGSARLDKYAQDLVVTWQYAPAKLDGNAIATWFPVRITWVLQAIELEVGRHLTTDAYPEASRQLKEQGTTTLRFLINPEGKVAKLLVDSPSGFKRLDDAAINAISKAHIIPPKLANGQTIGGWYRMSIGFHIDGTTSPSRPGDACLQPELSTGYAELIRACENFIMLPDNTHFENARGHNRLGNSHRALKNFDAAIAEFSRGIEESPGYVANYIDRGLTYLIESRENLALADLDKAAEIAPLDPFPLLYRASAYRSIGYSDRAIADDAIVARLKPGPQMPSVVCRQMARLGKAEAGLEECEKAVSLAPKSASIIDLRGYAYFRIGEYEKAIADYDKAIAIDEDMSTSLYGRGVAKLKLGNADGAKDIEDAKAIKPTIAEEMAKFGITP